jgi:hypothetical protein
LQWSVAADSRVVGYRVYWGTSSRGYLQGRGAGVAAGAGTSYVIGNLQSGRTYFFAATAYDAAGNESDFSAEASKTIP